MCQTLPDLLDDDDEEEYEEEEQEQEEEEEGDVDGAFWTRLFLFETSRKGSNKGK